MKRAISLTMHRSVQRHARDLPAPDLEDSAMLRLGGGHYREMCVVCHGAPGAEPSEIGKGWYPNTPKLVRAAEESFRAVLDHPERHPDDRHTGLRPHA